MELFREFTNNLVLMWALKGLVQSNQILQNEIMSFKICKFGLRLALLYRPSLTTFFTTDFVHQTFFKEETLC